ncbi:cold shock domain-containing protein E1-like, partial [Tropilaelaps mercedesae]
NIHQGGSAGGGGPTQSNQNTNQQQTQQQQNQKQQHTQQQQSQVAASGSSSPQKASKGRRGARSAETRDEEAQQTNGNSGSRYQGVVCTLKDTYGFVERADVVKEIFFHCTEGYQGIALGDDVSFDISMRNNREVAVNLQRLPCGTVIFEDTENCIRRGTVSKLPNQTEEPLDGRVKYEDNGGIEKEVGFGDRDLSPSMWTTQVGDPVDFQLATDRRDGLKRATNISMAVTAPTAFVKENRLTGTVVALKDNFGFVNAEQGNAEYYFKLSEVLDPELRIDTIVQFSLAAENHGGQGGNNQRQVAIRLCKVPTPGGPSQSSKKKASRKSGSATNSNAKYTHRGYVVALKEQFGFIEAENRQEDLFFHYSIFEGDVKELTVGSEVEYSSSTKNARQSADCVRALDRGTVPGMELMSKDHYAGKVVRTLRCFCPDQTPYCGLVQLKPSPDENKETSEADPNANGESDSANKEPPPEYEFSVMSLSKKGDVIHKGNSVTFQLAVCKVTQKVMAVTVKVVRERKTATLEALKGQYGYLNYDVSEKGGDTKKLLFPLNEVRNGVNLQIGDILEFDLVKAGRNNKFVAMNVSRIKEKETAPRPAALVNRIKGMAISDDGPRVIAIREPKGPDGSRGFALSAVAVVPAVA